ncbi:MAG: hypothetical protein ABIQ08_10390 [Duganella sp.]
MTKATNDNGKHPGRERGPDIQLTEPGTPRHDQIDIGAILIRHRLVTIGA